MLHPEKLNDKKLITLSFIILIIASYFSVGYNHLDEHFQILEFAGSKVNLTAKENLPWEFHEQMRPAIQPGFVVLFWKFFALWGTPNPFLVTFLLRLFSATLSFLSIFMMYKRYIKEIEVTKLKKWFLFLSFFLWFNIYNSVRFSSENIAGSLFLLAFAIQGKKENTSHNLGVGLLIGLSFITRFQTAFLIIGWLSYLIIIKREIKNSLMISLGVFIIFCLGLLIDKWFYGNWVFTSFNYLNLNIFQNKVSDFGTQAWWYYLSEAFIKAIPPFGILYISAFVIVLFFSKRNILTWTLFPFTLIHFLIGHKELRFLFPLLNFIPILIIQSIELVNTKWNINLLEKKFTYGFIRFFWTINIFALFYVSVKPAEKLIEIYQKIYTEYPNPSKLLYINDNPYLGSSDVYFYRRSNLTMKKINSPDEIKIEKNYNTLFVTRDISKINNSKLKYKIIYSTYPKWMWKLNFNHWMERSNIYYLVQFY